MFSLSNVFSTFFLLIFFAIILFFIYFFEDDVTNGPTHGAMSRLKLGLAVRKAGILYPQAIQLALSHLLLEILNKESEIEYGSNSKEGYCRGDDEESREERMRRGQSVAMDVDTNNDNNSNNRGESKYYSILDVLVSACQLQKLSDAAMKYHQSYPSLLSTSDSNDLNQRLLCALSLDADSNGENQYENKNQNNDEKEKENENEISNSNSNSNNYINNSRSSKEIKMVLIACNHVLEALTVLNLTESYKMTPLIDGDRMKETLKKIPKGTMFGEVRYN